MLMNISCKKEFFPEDDKLYLERQDYTGAQIRLDGYYHLVTYEKKIAGGYFFYRNGIIVSLGGVQNTPQEYDDYIKRVTQIENFYSRKGTYGVFVVNDSSILFEKLYPAQPWEAFIREGVILNDTTFHIHISYRMVNGEKTEVREKDETYHFRQFSPKPDSANNFVK